MDRKKYTQLTYSSISKLENNNFIDIVDYITDSPDRKYAVIKINYEGRLYILKVCDPLSPKYFKDLFNTEYLFYKKQKERLIHKNYSGEYFYMIDFIDGETLGDRLFSDTNSKINFIEVFKCIDLFYKTYRQNNESIKYTNLFYYANVLVSSGPRQKTNKRKKGKIAFVIKQICVLSLHIITFTLKFRNTETFLPGLSHGDLHYNNILISNTGPEIIDFKNIRSNEFFLFDIIFLLTIIEKKTNLNDDLQDIKSKYLSSWESLFVYKIFKILANFNSRF